MSPRPEAAGRDLDVVWRRQRAGESDGHGGNGGATGQLWLVSIDFPNAGTVGYFCETHGAPGTGMFGTINVIAAAVVGAVGVGRHRAAEVGCGERGDDTRHLLTPGGLSWPRLGSIWLPPNRTRKPEIGTKCWLSSWPASALDHTIGYHPLASVRSIEDE